MSDHSSLDDSTPSSFTSLPSSAQMPSYVRASLTAAAAAAVANYPSSGQGLSSLAAYSYMYPYLSSTHGLYGSSASPASFLSPYAIAAAAAAASAYPPVCYTPVCSVVPQLTLVSSTVCQRNASVAIAPSSPKINWRHWKACFRRLTTLMS